MIQHILTALHWCNDFLYGLGWILFILFWIGVGQISMAIWFYSTAPIRNARIENKIRDRFYKNECRKCKLRK